MIDTKCGLCGNEKMVLNPITISRLTDFTGAFISGMGYLIGSPDAMNLGMALYQANTGNRS